jgi:hypothetical protein
MKNLYLYLALALTSAVAHTQPAPQPLSNVLLDLAGYDWSTVQSEAAWEALNDGPMYYNAPPAVIFHENFEGTFTPLAGSTDTTRLAIFSDDGSNVFVDDVTNP